MKKWVLGFSVLVTVQSFAANNVQMSSTAQAANLSNYTVEVKDVTEEYRNRVHLQFKPVEYKAVTRKSNAAAVAPIQLLEVEATVTAVDVIVDKVINIGTKIWNVAAKGSPVLNYQNTAATALPANIHDWTELENWKDPQTKVYTVVYKFLGIEVVHFTYQVVLLSGGDFKGIGRYIGYAAVEAVDVQAGYFHDFSADAVVEKVYNKGSSADPLAAMVLTVRWKMTPKMGAKKIGSQTFSLDGLGNIKVMASTQQ